MLLLGVVSLFADFAYEGSRSVLGPYLALLGASAFAVGAVTGFGELAGYGLRLFSGPIADRTKQYWPITLTGYAIQMIAVPALAFTHSWPEAAILIVAERAGRAIRNPPKSAMLAHAGKQAGGIGWAFGLNEALDQTGAMVGPLVIAGVLAWRHDYHLAFAVLAAPAAVTLALMVTARLLYPRPQDLERKSELPSPVGLPRAFWIYMAGAALAGAGLADYPLIAYHFTKAQIVPGAWIAVFYAVAMGTAGAGSLVFGRLFDRIGFRVLIVASLIAALFAPLVFLGGFWSALAGAAVWGVATGVFESIIPAAVTPMVGPERRASAFGLFSAVYGTAWFAGSALIGFLYDRSLSAVIVFCVAAELAAAPFFVWAARSKPNSDLR
ncbi:MAG TPA: MFS transporter [Caulobacteraceae bacterium]|nr:MFS transporter [Caulobacteraceae bacterium]